MSVTESLRCAYGGPEACPNMRRLTFAPVGERAAVGPGLALEREDYGASAVASRESSKGVASEE
jgi:hypothetical protein